MKRNQITRRRFLQGAAVSGALVTIPGAFVGCGDDDAATQPPASATASGAASASATVPAAARRGPSKGTLRVSEPFLPATLDVDSGTASSNLQSLGVVESLMRYTPTLKVEPWLASKLERIDPLTWRVTLRDDITFWDGTRVDAQAVSTSLQRSMEKQPSVADLLPAGTKLTADALVLTITTPVPVGLMANNLAAANLVIKKLDGENIVGTGPFRVTSFTARESMTLEAYAGYRGGPANIKTITARQVADTGARSLALQAGDVEIAQALLAADIPRLRAAGHQVWSSPWARQHMVVLNVNQPPLDDVSVRRAFALAVDRDALVKGILEGAGSPAYGIAPEDVGLTGIVRSQKYDLAEAKRVLDAAGWKPGSDGVREKNGKRLSFKLATYSGRAELEAMAVVLLEMAKSAGMDVSIEKVPDIEAALAANSFAAATYSIGSAAFGDLSRLLATLYTPSPRNKGRYDNPAVTGAFKEYLTVDDAARQAVLLRQMQDAIGQDVPIVHLANPYQVVAAAKGVKSFAPHPLDSYKYTAEMELGA